MPSQSIPLSAILIYFTIVSRELRQAGVLPHGISRERPLGYKQSDSHLALLVLTLDESEPTHIR